ncbi:hypothetical protein OG455_38305 [Kitasatospora sp. NBC_01287]|uniref:hypothetical protein n=1 Tax=Kitasatospora sp. NBC_01287 TaxID=2903573 RepID=UPI0022553B4F|nr:hypothetical protein [Kitasatospora sp. NBC_01287]MCX4751290.1 hypothetical protein [Kitasatospora sp. NBC_01287]
MIFILIPAAAVAYAIGLLAFLRRRRPADTSPHSALAPVPNLLASIVVLLSSFEVVTGWAAHTTAQAVHPPEVVFGIDVLASAALLAYPALAGLPFTPRYQVLVGLFAALVGAVVALSWRFQH